jgi:hypothetical protein
MKLAPSIGLGLILLAALAASPPGHAQGLPQGTYLDTCSGARVEGASLIARCRGADGMEQHSALLNFDRCAGDIANNNGVLSCNFGVAGPVPAPMPAPPPVTRVAVDCNELHRQAADLHARLDATFDPIERARLDGRLHEVHDQEDHCTQ